MATAEDLRNEFTSFMDREGIVYQVTSEENNVVRMSFSGSDSKGGGAHTTIWVDFDENDNNSQSVHFAAERFARCTPENLPVVIMKVNDYNMHYRWVKFFVRRDGDNIYLCADSDAMLIPGAAAIECVGSVFRMSDIVEDVILDLGDLVEPDDGKDQLRAMIAALQSMLDE